MGENFLKFKKKAFTVRLIKSILLGLAAGTLLSGICLLLFKFEIIKAEPILSLPIGAGAFLLAGVVGYLLLRTSDKVIAKRLDKEFALSEKVQTMLAYKDEDGTIFELQRKDANESLANVSKRKFKFKRLWLYILCFLIGAGALAAGFLFSPVEEPEPIQPEEGFALTEIQKAAMQELIAYVENSQMQAPYKENVASELQSLLSLLEQATTASQKDAALKTAVENIYSETDNSSTAVELMNALWSTEAETAKSLAQALNYYDWSQSGSWEEYSEKMTNFRIVFVHADAATEKPDAQKMTAETGELLAKVETNVSLSLTRAAVPTEDELSVQLKRFMVADESYPDGSHLYGFTTLSEKAETLGYEKLQKELDATFAEFNMHLFPALETHLKNTSTGEYALTKLKELFLCTLPKFERPNFYASSEGGTLPDGEGGGGGGGIGGDTTYGSDDLVLDPLTNTYVEYGTILDKYYALMFGKVQDGDYTEQEKEAMEKYFAILYGGFEEGE